MYKKEPSEKKGVQNDDGRRSRLGHAASVRKSRHHVPAISRLIHALPSPPSPAVAPLALAPPPHKLARVSLSLLSSFCEKGDICSQVFLSENQGV